MRLDVTVVHGRGGGAGLSYVVSAESIPPEHLVKPLPAPAPAPMVEPEVIHIDTSKPLQPVRIDYELLDFKTALAETIVHATLPGTPARAAAIRALASQSRYPSGRKRGKRVSERALRRWVAKYEPTGDIFKLVRKSRPDWRKRRVLISRPVDRLLIEQNVSREAHERLAEKVKEQIAAQWASGAGSWPNVRMNVMLFLVRELRARGCRFPIDELKPLCMLPRRTIEKARGYKAIAIYHLDKQKSADIQIPRVRRDRSHLKPMDWLAGDVHHVDIAFRRDDGSICTPKAVAWMDLATNRAFLTVFIMAKGEMIRREHVIESFVAMCTHHEWGVPANLYLDRGSEYQWTPFIDDLLELKSSMQSLGGRLQIEDRKGGTQRARAYNPQSKVIESLFNALERGPFQMIPGHIGGNRMKKKTENQGRPPQPYPGTFEELRKDISDALCWYHEKPQGGHLLKGQCPNERFKRHIAAGWHSTVLDADELTVAFMEKASRLVGAGGVVSWKGNEYRADELIERAGTGRVIVGQPLFGERHRLLAFTEEDDPICLLEPVHALTFEDTAGAGDQAHQAKTFRESIRAHGHRFDRAIVHGSLDAAASITTPSGATPDGVATIHTGHAAAASMLRGRADIPAADAERRRRLENRALLEKAATAKRSA